MQRWYLAPALCCCVSTSHEGPATSLSPSCQNLQTASLRPRITVCEAPHKPRHQHQASSAWIKESPGDSTPGRRAPRLARGRIAAKLNRDLTADKRTLRSPTHRSGEDAPPPPKNQLPAEGPLSQPSLALNIDQVPVHPLTRFALPQPPARAPIQSCSSYSPLQLTRRTLSSHLHLIQLPTPAPDPVKSTLCISSSPGLLSPVSLPVQPTPRLYHPQARGRTPIQIKAKTSSHSQSPLPLSLVQSRSPLVCNS